jgi:hypothetical protein
VYPIRPGANDPYFVPLQGGRLAMSRAGKYILQFPGDNRQEITVPALPADSLKSPWDVSFDTAWGGPAHTVFDSLISWPQSEDKGIKYYSGTAVYSNSFRLNKDEMDTSYRILLDLGTVFNLAELKVNGHNAGILWKAPFAADITPYVKEGMNNLEIKVVNLWPNRLIGDQFLSTEKRYAHTNVIKFKKDSPLMPSGLLGPVVIRFGPCLSLP